MATKKKPVKNTPEPPAAPPVESCRKCGGTQLITQLRKVVVDVGWKISQIHAVAPCKMCMKCGNHTVAVNAVIGDLAGLIPDPEVVQAKKRMTVNSPKPKMPHRLEARAPGKKSSKGKSRKRR